MNRIQGYFNSLARQISAEAQRAGTGSHKPDIGSNREIIVERFFRNHLPKRLTPFVGGNIVGFGGEESKQMDIIVSNDLSVRFDEDEKTFTLAEGVASAVTVKSRLDKDAVEDCLLNLASIPQADPSVLSFEDPLRKNLFSYFVERHPSLHVFAFDGVKPETCLEHVNTFYQRYPEIPKNRYPLTMTVNGKYLIHYFKTDTRVASGGIVKAGNFHLAELEEHMIGYPLVHMLTNVSYYTSFLPNMSIATHRYFNAGFGLPPPIGEETVT